MDDREARARVAELETRLGELEALADPAARATAVAAVQALVELYGEGLARIVDRVGAAADAALADALAGDELVAHLLLLHGLHPDDAPTRIRRALETLQPELRRQGASVELAAMDDGVAQLRLSASGGGCASTAAALRQRVQAAVHDAAPELERVTVEEAAPAPVLVPLTVARRTGARAATR